jgi:branched-chain amino acid transport system permease protein
MDQVLTIVVSILTSVATLLLISVGLAVIFGLMRVINLAHGEFLMLGAYAVLVGTRNGISVWLAIPLAGLAVGIFGAVIERLLIRPLYGRILDTLLATWGLSLVLVQAVSIVFGPATNGIGTPLGSVHVGGYSFSQYSLVLIAMALVTLTVVYALFTRTRYGVMARAAIQNPPMARALGIDTARMNMLTFGIGSGLAGLAGALLAPVAGVVPSFGQAYIAQAFMTVIVGGPDVITGTSAAAVLLGGSYSFVSYLTTPFIGQAALLLIAIVLLRILPQGLSGNWRTYL